MAKFSLVFIAVFCVLLQVTLGSSLMREKREEPTEEKKTAFDDALAWLNTAGDTIKAALNDPDNQQKVQDALNLVKEKGQTFLDDVKTTFEKFSEKKTEETTS
uniref:CSON008486 protein n=1 Tax=Culicoides sonorensis TaxID=179676 RepID=A0A336LYQ7_CULSO